LFSQKVSPAKTIFAARVYRPFSQLPSGISRSRLAAPHLPHSGIARIRAEARLFRRASGECIFIGELEAFLRKNTWFLSFIGTSDDRFRNWPNAVDQALKTYVIPPA
jgi:hypothetical protein